MQSSLDKFLLTCDYILLIMSVYQVRWSWVSHLGILQLFHSFQLFSYSALALCFFVSPFCLIFPRIRFYTCKSTFPNSACLGGCSLVCWHKLVTRHYFINLIGKMWEITCFHMAMYLKVMHFFHCFYQVLKTESGGLILGLDFKIETATREVRPEAYMTVL